VDPIKNTPSEAAEIYHIDIDPLKEQMPLWYIEPHRSFRADAAQALQAIGDAAAALDPDAAALAEKTAHYAARSAARRARVAQEVFAGEGLTIARLMAALREQFDGQTIVMNEGITNYQPVFDHLAPCVLAACLPAAADRWAGTAARQSGQSWPIPKRR
jgi:acetolactate synthase-1/2/3 large subunit